MPVSINDRREQQSNSGGSAGESSGANGSGTVHRYKYPIEAVVQMAHAAHK